MNLQVSITVIYHFGYKKEVKKIQMVFKQLISS